MTDANATLDQDELTSDARFDSSLERVSFQSGILLGAEALSDEQAFHLRRLTRHRRWLVGPGTVFGLYVEASVPQGDATDLRLTVHPGYAIDGLGREIVVAQAYAVSLRDWLAASPQNVAAGGTIFLRVTARGRATESGLQPVVADLFDAGLNPVVAARVDTGFQLEILVDDRQLQDAPALPLDVWAPGHATPAAADLPGAVTTREQATLAGAPADQAAMLKMQSWLLHQAPPGFDDSPGTDSAFVEAARLLLASVHVTLDATGKPSLAGTAVNNLVRPFVRPNVLLNALSLP